MQNFRIMNPTCEEAPFASSRGEAHHWRTLLAEGRCRYKDLPATGANPFDPASAHELHRLPLYRFNLRRPRNRWVQRRQHATSADRKPQQIRIRHLLVPQQPDPAEGNRFRHRNIILPEGVVLRDCVRRQNRDRVAGECLFGVGRV